MRLRLREYESLGRSLLSVWQGFRRNLRGLAELGAEFGEGMETGLNHWVRAPAPAVPLDYNEVRGFGSEALEMARCTREQQ